MYNAITSIKIDKDKRDMAKAKGLKLQDLLDEALNVYLNLDDDTNEDLEKEKEEIIKKINDLEAKKKLELKNISNKYDLEIKRLNHKLKIIDNKIEEANDDFVLKMGEEMKKTDYYNLLRKLNDVEGDTDDKEFEEMFNKYMNKYGLSNEEATDVYNKLVDEFNATFTV